MAMYPNGPPVWARHTEFWPTFNARLFHGEVLRVDVGGTDVEVDAEKTDDPALAEFLGLPVGQVRVGAVTRGQPPPLVLTPRAAHDLAVALLQEVYAVEGAAGEGPTHNPTTPSG